MPLPIRELRLRRCSLATAFEWSKTGTLREGSTRAWRGGSPRMTPQRTSSSSTSTGGRIRSRSRTGTWSPPRFHGKLSGQHPPPLQCLEAPRVPCRRSPLAIGYVSLLGEVSTSSMEVWLGESTEITLTTGTCSCCSTTWPYLAVNPCRSHTDTWSSPRLQTAASASFAHVASFCQGLFTGACSFAGQKRRARQVEVEPPC
mmetsp:Transcript_20492/g.54921  ORF Transcript_20492/g.54921 Transcript_20492/m.54921 type:complete len:201 (+) Transcript_20492:271-873(+)